MRFLKPALAISGLTTLVIVLALVVRQAERADKRAAIERSDDRCRPGEIMMLDWDGRLACIVGRRPG